MRQRLYRRDIQGLRGVAVLLVVLFHAGELLPGGYIGVDVFFVLSGFVVTRMLQRERRSEGRVRLGRFYARRIRRLLPASGLVAVMTLLGVLVFLSPGGEQQAAAYTALASSVFLANVQLHHVGDGYFSPAAELNPFLHVWSLSVEEQFYLVLPVALALLWRPGSTGRRAWIAVALASVASLLLSGLLAHREAWFAFDAGRFGFYLPFTRVWQFGVGVLLALSEHRWRRIGPGMSTLLATLGFGCIVGAAFAFSDATAFPGTAALVPVVGTGLLLRFGAEPGPVRSLLEWRPLVGSGDLSYSWYLWHWPLIVLVPLAYADAGGEVARWGVVAVAFASVVPAWCSWRFLEEPIRRGTLAASCSPAVIALVCLGAPALFAFGVLKGTERGWGLPEEVSMFARSAGMTAPCGSGVAASGEKEACIWGEDSERSPRILVVGDSHAGVLVDGVIAAARPLNGRVVLAFRKACPFLKGTWNRALPGCDLEYEGAWRIVNEWDPDIVIIGNRHAHYFPNPHVVEHPRPGEFRGPEDPADMERDRRYREALADAVDALLDRGARVILMAPVPEYPAFRVADSLWSTWIGTEGRTTMSREHLERQRAEGTRVVEHIAQERRHRHVQVIDPADALCDTTRCVTYRDHLWLYRDDNHINRNGALLLSPLVARALSHALDTSE